MIKKIYIGRFNTEEEAARARNAWDVANGRPPSNWLAPLLEEITLQQWEEKVTDLKRIDDADQEKKSRAMIGTFKFGKNRTTPQV
jgi:hypothetical protein